LKFIIIITLVFYFAGINSIFVQEGAQVTLSCPESQTGVQWYISSVSEENLIVSYIKWKDAYEFYNHLKDRQPEPTIDNETGYLTIYEVNKDIDSHTFICEGTGETTETLVEIQPGKWK
jgi:hypothetical protein